MFYTAGIGTENTNSVIHSTAFAELAVCSIGVGGFREHDVQRVEKGWTKQEKPVFKINGNPCGDYIIDLTPEQL